MFLITETVIVGVITLCNICTCPLYSFRVCNELTKYLCGFFCYSALFVHVAAAIYHLLVTSCNVWPCDYCFLSVTWDMSHVKFLIGLSDIAKEVISVYVS